MSVIRLITLDLDDTLWPCLPVIEAAEASLFDWLARHAPRITAHHDLDSLRERRKALARARPDIAHDLTALRLAHLEELLVEHDHDPALAGPGCAHFRAARNRVQPYPEVPDTLARLRRRYRLVALTNGNAQVEATPLAGCFDHDLNAAAVGAAKPDPAMFVAACDWAGVVPQEGLHVGDDPLRDVAPAAALGMRTAWLNRDGRDWPDTLPSPDLVLGDLRALVDALDTPLEEQRP